MTMTEDVATSTSAVPHRINPWLTLVTSAASVLGLTWTVVQFFNPLQDLDVTVVAHEGVEFSLPPAASSLQKLALTYDGQPTRRISLVPVTIVNSGNSPIRVADNAQSREWTVALRSKSGAPIERVGDVTRSPNYAEAWTEPGPTPAVLHVKTPLLNAGESISFQVAVIGDGDRYSIEAAEVGPRIPNLRLATTLDSVQNRIRNAFIAPLWIVAALGLLALFGRDVKRGLIHFRPVSAKLVGELVAAVFVVTFASAMTAAGASWLLAWMVYFAAFR